MNNNGRYILDGHKAVPCDNLTEWAKMFKDMDARRVARTEINDDVYVSTVFLGLDHSFNDDARPLLFETMVFGGSIDEDTDRYATWEEAEIGHKKMVERVKLESKDAT